MDVLAQQGPVGPHMGVRLAEDITQNTNRVKVTRCRMKMARATRAESVMPRMVSRAKTTSTTAVASMTGSGHQGLQIFHRGLGGNHRGGQIGQQGQAGGERGVELAGAVEQAVVSPAVQGQGLHHLGVDFPV